MRETVINPPVRGAQRSVDTTFPSPQAQTIGTVSLGLNWIDRQGFAVQDRGTNTTVGAPPGGGGWDLYRGRIGNKMTGSGAPSGSFYLSGAPLQMINFFQNGPGNVGGAFEDDFSCWRILAILAFDGSGLGSGDLGLEVGANLNYNIITALGPGFRLAPTAAGQISFQVRQSGGGGLTINQVVANVDVNDWHAYELRFIGATSTADAVVKALVDGVQVASAGYGAGTLLPNWGNGAVVGYSIGIGNRGANAAFVAAMGLQVSAAATEAGLL